MHKTMYKYVYIQALITIDRRKKGKCHSKVERRHLPFRFVPFVGECRLGGASRGMVQGYFLAQYF